MTSRPPPRSDAHGSMTTGFQARLTAALALRQFLLLFLVGTSWLAMWFFFKYGTGSYVITWNSLWTLPPVGFKYFALPAILVFVYGFILFAGILFALGPSERSFNFYFYSMIFALLLVNYDHSIIDWVAFTVVKFRIANIVSAFKIILAGPFLLFVALMHYNILADDFTRRMLRRGVPTEEALRIRPKMLQVLFPTVVAASALAAALALVGEVSAFVFNYHGLFVRKLNLLLLAGIGVAVAFTLRSILREMGRRGGKGPPETPNR